MDQEGDEREALLGEFVWPSVMLRPEPAVNSAVRSHTKEYPLHLPELIQADCACMIPNYDRIHRFLLGEVR